MTGRLDAAVAVGSGPAATLAALRSRGAQHFDPVRFRHIDALARRAAGHEGRVRQLLDAQLVRLLAVYRERYEQARAAAGETLDRLVAQHPQAADALRQLQVDGDFKALHRRAAALNAPGPAGPLAELVRHIERQSAALGDAERAADHGVAAGGPPAELKAVRYFRSTWSRLSVDQQLTRSLARVPENAGPLNSQRLVLRSLQLMREVSPAYLSRFMSYVDTLLWLDQAHVAGPPAPAGARRGEADKKRKPGRGRPS
ncbi:MAG: DUF2894 domain-containing protein [Microbacteriaceae bacterium]|nr:DUF2894 domain-containing protein [Burkholderiaceae bacterium]